MDDGINEDDNIERIDAIPVPPVMNNQNIGESGRPIIGNQTIFKDGSSWKVRDDILNTNFADKPRQQAFWIWDINDISLSHTFFDYWVHQIKFSQVDSWVECTSDALRQRRQAVTSRGEIVRYLGIRLAAVIERRRGGVEACIKPRSANKEEGTIAEGGDYEAIWDGKITIC